ncbi:MAG: hypothetical protein F6K31_00360 [Symploca sp. SIO2G7]|nr:hypothetical protein [Symploca sp. SIO2G7]
MSIKVTGVIQRQDIGMGVWALVAESGETYELRNAPNELQQPQLKVQVEGIIRDDIMTIAMIGPVLEIQSFELLR